MQLRRNTQLALAGLVTLAGLTITVAIVAIGGEAADSYTPTPQSTFGQATTLSAALSQAQAWSGYPLYNVGSSYPGVGSLVAVRHDYRAADAEMLAPMDFVSFLYGSCTIPADTDGHADGGCPSPLQIQIWPATSRNLTLYGLSCGLAFRPATIRGVPADVFDDRLEFQTGPSTVVIFGSSASEELAVAAALRGLNNGVEADDPLPAPTGVPGPQPRCG